MNSDRVRIQAEAFLDQHRAELEQAVREIDRRFGREVATAYRDEVLRLFDQETASILDSLLGPESVDPDVTEEDGA